MYKTVRHGENSLQYTILPQQDDAGVGSGGLCRSGGRTRRRGRLPLVLVITLILAGGAVAAAVLIPLLVTSDLVQLPAALQRLASNRHPVVAHPPRPNSTTPPLTTLEDTFNTLTTSANYYNKTLDRKDDDDDDDDDDDSSTKMSPISADDGDNNESVTSKSPTVSPASTQTMMTEHLETQPSTSTVNSEAVITLAGLEHLTRVKNSTSNIRIIVEASMPSSAGNTSANKTLLVPDDMGLSTAGPFMEAVTKASTKSSTDLPKHRSWLEPRWPFADPSSYFHWTGYNGRDSLLLPLILGAALLVLLLAVGICYTLRRRRQKTIRRQTIGKISSDLQCGDKATLLPDGSEEE